VCDPAPPEPGVFLPVPKCADLSQSISSAVSPRALTTPPSLDTVSKDGSKTAPLPSVNTSTEYSLELLELVEVNSVKFIHVYKYYISCLLLLVTVILIFFQSVRRDNSRSCIIHTACVMTIPTRLIRD
jgi:hypothetical protein